MFPEVSSCFRSWTSNILAQVTQLKLIKPQLVPPQPVFWKKKSPWILNLLCSAKVSISVDTNISLTEKGWFCFVQVSLPRPLHLLRKTVWEDVPSLGSYFDITVFRCLVSLDIIIGRYWPVEHHLCMYISCLLVNGEDRPHSLSWECIFHCIISPVHLCVELQRKLCVRKSLQQILYCFLIYEMICT